jgi:hypothetical protein
MTTQGLSPSDSVGTVSEAETVPFGCNSGRDPDWQSSSEAQ